MSDAPEDRRRLLATAGAFRVAARLAFVVGVLGAAGAPSATAAADGGDLDRLAWLAGCWARDDGDRVSEEQWMRPLGGTMLGSSRTVAGGQVVAWERLRIEDAAGTLVYTALPSGQQEASFSAIELADGLVVFENPQHDFPQRIRYRLLADGTLLAQIEGEREGEVRVVDFPFRRVTCEGAVGDTAPARDRE